MTMHLFQFKNNRFRFSYCSTSCTLFLICAKLAICSPNFVQVGRDRKMVFAGWDIKNVEPKVRLFFMSHPAKNCFLIKTFPYESKILRTHIIFCRDCTFLKPGGLENSRLMQ